MKKKILFYAPQRCSGCRRCEMACALQLEGVCDPAAASIRVLLHPRLGVPSLALQPDCTGCGVCVRACNLEALQQVTEEAWADLMEQGWAPVPVLVNVTPPARSEGGA